MKTTRGEVGLEGLVDGKISTLNARIALGGLIDGPIHNGESVIITRRGAPVARLAPLDRKETPDGKKV